MNEPALCLNMLNSAGVAALWQTGRPSVKRVNESSGPGRWLWHRGAIRRDLPPLWLPGPWGDPPSSEE